MWLGLAISALLATAATAAQLFPVVEFTQQTTRASEGGTHELYAFSIEPHRLIELIWPNIWGAQFGSNTYWAPLIRLPGAYPEDLGAVALPGWIDVRAGAFRRSLFAKDRPGASGFR